MKRVLWVVATIVAFITSCTKNSESTDFIVAPSEDFTAILGSDTRTTLDGTSVKWCEDDLLTIFTKTAHNRKYEISELSDDRSSATFSFVSYTGADNTPVTANYALYPYDAEATISGNVITTTIATEQSYVKNSTNLSYALMVAKSDNTTFTFSNAGALIRFNISKIVPDSFTLQSITLTSAANKLSGEVTIDTSADCKAVVSSTGSNSVTLANIDTAIPDAGLSFYVSLPATNFDTDDLTATITFKEGVKEFVLPAFELAQGKIKTVSYSIADADDFTGNIPGDDGGDDTPVIEPKPANNEIWYTTTDGKKIFPEVVVDPIKFGAILISNTYTDGLGIMTFDDDITSIAGSAFSGCTSLTSMTIPDSVTTIGAEAFRDCDSLTSVTIPDSVMTIGEKAFSGCSSLKEFKGKFAADGGRCLIMDGVLNAFAIGCGVTQYAIPDSVKTIGSRAFENCDSLTSVTIGNSVKTIGDYAFEDCDSLTSVTIGNSVTTIGNWAFAWCDSLTSVTIGNSVTTIGDYAFYACNRLTSVTIPDSVTTIGEEAFGGCSSLTSVTIGKGVTSWGWRAFAGCKGELIINSNIPSVPSEYSPFYSSKFTKVTIGDSVTKIGDYAFGGCNSLTSVTIGNSVKTIGDYAFYECKSLTSVTIPDRVTTIGSSAFCYCNSLTSVTIGDSVTTIGVYAFYDCYKLTSVTIGDSVKTIGADAFWNCGLTSVTIPDSVTTIGKVAFGSCDSLATVYCKPTTPPTGDFAMFDGNAAGRRIFVPASDDDSIINAYKAASYWSGYEDYIFEEE